MKKILTLLLCLSVIFAGCGGGNDNKAPEGEKNFIVATGGEPNFLDPAIAGDAVTTVILGQMYDGLFSYDKDGNVVNELCESYEVSDDGLVYTFKLKESKWSDGQPVVADDFVFAMKRSVNYGAADSYYSSFIYQYVKNGADTSGKPMEELDDLGIRAVDDLTLEITLEKPVVYFVQLLQQSVFYPVREDYAKIGTSSWANDPAVPTNGAFKLEKINSKEEVVLVKNENYYNADKVSLDKITYLVMPDQQAQLNAFKTGEIHFAMNVPADVVHSYAGKPELFKIDPYVINYFVTINADATENEALQDVRVRQALSLSVDRTAILKILNGGDFQYALHGFVPKGIPGANGDFRTEADEQEKLSDTDIELAKTLLEEAGYGASNPLKLTYAYNANQMHTDVAQALQAQWKEIGVTVELVTSEIRAFFDSRSNGDFELARHANSADYLDPMIYLEMYDSRNQGVAVVNDANYDAMLDAANAEKDPVKRMELLHDAEAYFVRDQAYVVPLFGYGNPYLLQDGIKGITSNPQGSVDFRFVTLP